MAKKKAARKPQASLVLPPISLIGHPDAQPLETAIIMLLTSSANRLMQRYREIHAEQATRARKATRARVAIRKRARR